MANRLKGAQRILRGFEVFVAGVVLLLLMQVHGAITSTALLLAGLRTDVPAFATIGFSGWNGPCRAAIPVSPPFGPEGIAGCGDRADVQVVLPSGSSVEISNNGIVQRQARDVGPLVSVDDIRLRDGRNVITVANQDGDATGSQSFGMQRYASKFANIPVINPQSALVVYRPWAFGNPQRIAQWNYGGRAFELWQGIPQESFGPSRDNRRLGNDGLAVITANLAGAARQDSQLRAGEAFLSREVVIEKDADGLINVRGDACLPANNVVARWAQFNEISAPELLWTLTGIFVGGPQGALKGTDRVSTESTPSCVTVHFTFQQRGSYLYAGGSGSSFLAVAGDRLELKGFAREVEARPRPTGNSDDMIWNGAPELVDRASLLSLQPSSKMVVAGSGLATSAPPPSGLVRAGNRLSTAIAGTLSEFPPYVVAAVYGLAAAIPIALILWVLYRHRTHFKDEKWALRGIAGLTALIALWLAVAAQPLLSQAANTVVNFLDIGIFLEQARGGYLVRTQNLYAPIAIAAAMIVIPVLRAYSSDVLVTQRPIARALSALVSLLTLAAGVVMLFVQRSLWPADAQTASIVSVLKHWDFISWFHAQQIITSIDQVMILSAVWFASALLVLWAPVYWLYRAALPRGNLFWTAVLGSVVIFYLPLMPYLVEAARLSLALAIPDASRAFAKPDWGFIPALAGALPVTIIVTVLLIALKEISLTMLDERLRSAPARLVRWTYLLAAAVVLTFPMLPRYAADPSIAGSNIVNFLATLQQFGLVVALLAPLSALYASQAAVRDYSIDAFTLDDTQIDLLAAAFAGYLTLWTHDPISVLVAAGSAWFIFKRFVIAPPPLIEPDASGHLAEKLLTYREKSRLWDNRLRTIEDQYAKGAIDYEALSKEQAHRTLLENEMRIELGGDPHDAKQRLFGFGPEKNAFTNAVRGAQAGIAFATVLLLAQMVFSDSQLEAKPLWESVAQTILTDPAYTVVAGHITQTEWSNGEMNSVELLEVIAGLANSYLLWAVMGFLFGFCFHRVRGQDGFAKSATFGFGIAAVFIVAQLIAGGGGIASLTRLLPVFLFLVIVGTLVFDARSLEKQNVSPLRLPMLYGLRASIGYVSLAGLIAATQPLLQLASQMFGAKGK
jgi:hypothetical protein